MAVRAISARRARRRASSSARRGAKRRCSSPTKASASGVSTTSSRGTGPAASVTTAGDGAVRTCLSLLQRAKGAGRPPGLRPGRGRPAPGGAKGGTGCRVGPWNGRFCKVEHSFHSAEVQRFVARGAGPSRSRRSAGVSMSAGSPMSPHSTRTVCSACSRRYVRAPAVLGRTARHARPAGGPDQHRMAAAARVHRRRQARHQLVARAGGRHHPGDRRPAPTPGRSDQPPIEPPPRTAARPGRPARRGPRAATSPCPPPTAGCPRSRSRTGRPAPAPARRRAQHHVHRPAAARPQRPHRVLHQRAALVRQQRLGPPAQPPSRRPPPAADPATSPFVSMGPAYRAAVPRNGPRSAWRVPVSSGRPRGGGCQGGTGTDGAFSTPARSSATGLPAADAGDDPAAVSGHRISARLGDGPPDRGPGAGHVPHGPAGAAPVARSISRTRPAGSPSRCG